MINPNAYYTVQAWMVNDLGLNGNELALYAIIWGFSQDGRSEFVGSISYIQEWLGCSSRTTAINTLKSLIKKGLVVKKVAKNGFDSNAYKALPNPLEGSTKNGPGVVQKMDQGSTKNGPGVVQKMDQGSTKNGPGVVQNLDGGSTNFGPNNNYINIDSNNYINIGTPAAPAAPAPAEEKENKPVKHKYGEYRNVLLTDEDLAKLQAEFPTDWQDRIERLSEYIASKGAKYKNHLATIRNWAKRDKAQATPAAAGRNRRSGQVGPNGIGIDPGKTDLDAYFQ